MSESWPLKIQDFPIEAHADPDTSERPFCYFLHVSHLVGNACRKLTKFSSLAPKVGPKPSKALSILNDISSRQCGLKNLEDLKWCPTVKWRYSVQGNAQEWWNDVINMDDTSLQNPFAPSEII